MCKRDTPAQFCCVLLFSEVFFLKVCNRYKTARFKDLEPKISLKTGKQPAGEARHSQAGKFGILSRCFKVSEYQKRDNF